MDRICIIGAGVVGSYLAKRLSNEGYEIAVIDVNSSKIETLTANLDILGLNCDALDLKCLEDVKDYDLFIIVTDSDEKNICIASILKAFFKKEKLIIRVSKNVFAAPPIKELLSVDAVNVLTEVITKIIDVIRFPFAQTSVRFEKGKLILFKYKVETTDSFSGKQIKDFVEIRKKIPFTIAAIERDGKIILPKGDTFIYSDDLLFFVVEESHVKEFLKELLPQAEKIDLIFILGYSEFVNELLRRLAELEDIKVKFVDPDIRNCEAVASEFPNVSVLHGEITDIELLKSEGIEDAGLVIGITEDEENNILSCILAKRLGAKRAAALITHQEYEKIVESIGVDVPIVPRKLIASRVYSNLTTKGFLDVFELQEDLEILELKVREDWIGKTVKEVRFKECPLILGVKRGREVHVVRGTTKLKDGDILICVKVKEK